MKVFIVKVELVQAEIDSAGLVGEEFLIAKKQIRQSEEFLEASSVYNSCIDAHSQVQTTQA